MCETLEMLERKPNDANVAHQAFDSAWSDDIEEMKKQMSQKRQAFDSALDKALDDIKDVKGQMSLQRQLDSVLAANMLHSEVLKDVHDDIKVLSLQAINTALAKVTIQNEVFKIHNDIEEMKKQFVEQSAKVLASDALPNFLARELHNTVRAVFKASDEIKELQEQMQTLKERLLKECHAATPKQCFV